MNDNRLTNGSTAPLGLFLGLGLIFGAWILGSQIKATRRLPEDCRATRCDG